VVTFYVHVDAGPVASNHVHLSVTRMNRCFLCRSDESQAVVINILIIARRRHPNHFFRHWADRHEHDLSCLYDVGEGELHIRILP
jgi:hypothetical protein